MGEACERTNERKYLPFFFVFAAPGWEKENSSHTQKKHKETDKLTKIKKNSKNTQTHKHKQTQNSLTNKHKRTY